MPQKTFVLWNFSKNQFLSPFLIETTMYFILTILLLYKALSNSFYTHYFTGPNYDVDP